MDRQSGDWVLKALGATIIVALVVMVGAIGYGLTQADATNSTVQFSPATASGAYEGLVRVNQVPGGYFATINAWRGQVKGVDVIVRAGQQGSEWHGGSRPRRVGRRAPWFNERGAISGRNA